MSTASVACVLAGWFLGLVHGALMARSKFRTGEWGKR